MAVSERRALIEPEGSKVSILHQCELLDLSRSSYYYRLVDISPEDLILLRHLDELFTRFPCFGSRRQCVMLKQLGFHVGRDRVRRLMKMLGLAAIAPGKKVSKPAPGHTIHPYLLRGRRVKTAGEVWATDITYIRLWRGFVYLVAHMDWFSRYVLSWRLSTTLDNVFCIDSLKDALCAHGNPLIHNSDQGRQFTSEAYTSLLKQNGIAISMDGRGRWADNVFVERLWRTVKHECVYIQEFDTPLEAERRLETFFRHYNTERPHQALNYATPKQIWNGERSVDI